MGGLLPKNRTRKKGFVGGKSLYVHNRLVRQNGYGRGLNLAWTLEMRSLLEGPLRAGGPVNLGWEELFPFSAGQIPAGDLTAGFF